jgi:hypothetical protein
VKRHHLTQTNIIQKADTTEMITSFTLPGRVCSTGDIRRIAAESKTAYTMIQLKEEIEWVYLAKERMVQVMEMTGATMVYADHFAKMGEKVTEAPVIEFFGKRDAAELMAEMTKFLKFALTFQ